MVSVPISGGNRRVSGYKDVEVDRKGDYPRGVSCLGSLHGRITF